MKYEPIFDNVAIILDEKAQTSNDGIVLPQTIQSDYVTGRVVAVGPGYIQEVYATDGTHRQEHRKPPVAIGDRVMMNSWNAEKFMPLDDNKKLVVVNAPSILAIIKE